MKLAETKRYFIYGENWVSPSLGIGDFGSDIYVANAFAPPPVGSGDSNMTGNQIIDPMVKLKLSVAIRWGSMAATWTPHIPTVRVEAYLIAINDQLPTTAAPRLTSIAEDNVTFVEHPNRSLRWQFNSQNVTVIRKVARTFSAKDISFNGAGAATAEVATMKIAKRLRGTKEYEQSITTANVITQTEYLKGWNYYWMVISQMSAGTSPGTTSAVAPNPLEITSSRFLYYKDF